MRRLPALALAAALAAAPGLSAQTLDDLARAVREAAGAEAKINQEREARFQRERDNQRQLLAEARAEFAVIVICVEVAIII